MHIYPHYFRPYGCAVLHYSSISGIYSHTLQDEVDEMRRRRAGAAPEAEEVEMAAEESTLNPKPLKPL